MSICGACGQKYDYLSCQALCPHPPRETPRRSSAATNHEAAKRAAYLRGAKDALYEMKVRVLGVYREGCLTYTQIQQAAIDLSREFERGEWPKEAPDAPR